MDTKGDVFRRIRQAKRSRARWSPYIMPYPIVIATVDMPAQQQQQQHRCAMTIWNKGCGAGCGSVWRVDARTLFDGGPGTAEICHD